MAKIAKENLIETLVSKKCCDSKSAAATCLNTIIDEIVSNLKKGNEVTLTGFGTFRVSKRKAREGRNPKTGEAVKIPAKTVPKFKAGKTLREAVK